MRRHVRIRRHASRFVTVLYAAALWASVAGVATAGTAIVDANATLDGGWQRRYLFRCWLETLPDWQAGSDAQPENHVPELQTTLGELNIPSAAQSRILADNNSWRWLPDMASRMVEVRGLLLELHRRGDSPTKMGRIAEQYAALRFQIAESDPVKAAVIDLADQAELLQALPPAYALSLTAQLHYSSGRFDTAIASWRQLLALPVEQRTAITVKAQYMIGRAYLQRRFDDEALAAFAAVAALTTGDAAMPDPLRLRSEAEGWVGYIHTRRKEYVPAMRIYLDQYRSGTSIREPLESLQEVCRRAARLGANDPALWAVLQDAQMRDIQLVYLASNYYPPEDGWAEVRSVLAQLPETAGKPVPRADYVALMATERNQRENAEAWLALADPEAPNARWARAELLRRGGDTAAAVAALTALLDDPRHADLLDERLAWGRLARLHLDAGHYEAALAASLRSDMWPDTAYLCERVLTVAEAAGFLAAHDATDDVFRVRASMTRGGVSTDSVQLWRDMARVLARRLARSGDWAAAAGYFEAAGSEDLQALAARVAELKAVTAHAGHGDQTRAAAHYAQGRILMDHGADLLATELGPDAAIWDGRYSWYDTREQNGPPEAERLRVEASAPTPNTRFHYRMAGPEEYWAAAQLLPNDSPMLARALYEPGIYLRYKDPEAADRFYKALVRRCPNLQVGVDADKRRWFPAELDLTPVNP